MQKHVNLVDLVKSFPTNIYLQNLASIQKRTSPVKFDHLVEKSGKGSISNLSTKVTKADAAKKEALEEAKKKATGFADKLQQDSEAEKQREAEVARASAYTAKVAQDASSPAASGGASPAGAPAVPAFPESEEDIERLTDQQLLQAAELWLLSAA